MRVALAPALAMLALASGCGEEFEPETMVAGLRVLGIRSEPAELHPGQTALLSALVVDPAAPTRNNTVLWLACDPDPYDLGRSACSDLENLREPADLFSAQSDGSVALPAGMFFAGFGSQASYSAPASLFSVLPPDDRRRLSGSLAQLLLFAVAEEISPLASRAEIEALLERVRAREVPSVVALFRIRVTEQSPPNRNPVLGEVRVGGIRVPEGAHVALRPAEQAPLTFTAPDDAFESYEQILPDGSETRTERLIAAPYATGGFFSLERVVLGEQAENVYTAPVGDEDDPLPPPGRGRMWIVVRDTRGGQSWRELPLHVCEQGVPGPAVTGVTPLDVLAGEQPRVSLAGTGLESALDVFVGSEALRDAHWDPASARFEGVLPVLPAGEYQVTIRMRDCAEHDAGYRIRIQ